MRYMSSADRREAFRRFKNNEELMNGQLRFLLDHYQERADLYPKIDLPRSYAALIATIDRLKKIENQRVRCA